MSTPSADECAAFAERWIQAIEAGDIDAAGSMFDGEGLFELSTAGVELSAQARRGALQGFLAGIKGPTGLAGAICHHVSAGGTYKVLRLHDGEGEKRMLCRLLVPAGGVNYHDFTLVKDASGRVLIRDGFIYMTGEDLSTTMRRMFLQFAAHENRGILDRLKGTEVALVTHLNDVQKIIEAARQGQHAEVLRIYRSLPAELRREKFLLLFRLMAAQTADEAEYEAAMKEFRDRFPDNPTIDLATLDYFVLKGDHDRVLRMIDNIDEAVGGDPYLNAVRGNTLVTAGRFEEAKKSLQSAIDAEPDLEPAYWTMVSAMLGRREFGETLRWLKAIDEAFSPEWEDLSGEPLYADFVRSPEYAQWQEYLSTR